MDIRDTLRDRIQVAQKDCGRIQEQVQELSGRASRLAEEIDLYERVLKLEEEKIPERTAGPEEPVSPHLRAVVSDPLDTPPMSKGQLRQHAEDALAMISMAARQPVAGAAARAK